MSFLDKRVYRNRLNIIEEKAITGWEIWLQVELAFFLDKHENVMELVSEDFLCN